VNSGRDERERIFWGLGSELGAGAAWAALRASRA